MISDAIRHISGSTVPGIIGTILLMLGFVGVVIWAIRMDRGLVRRMSNLPLEPDDSRNDDRGEDDGRV